jgi:sec-independent protein translocase protein TatA
MPLRLPELLIVLLVIVLIFGARKIPELGAGIGKSIREFKKEVNDESPTSSTENKSESPKSLNAAQLEVEAIERELAMKRAALAAEQEQHK